MGRPRESVLSQIAASVSSQQFLDINPRRDGGMIYNNSTDDLFIALSDSVSTSVFTVKMVPSSYFELPERWQGEVWGVWSGTNGDAQVTEFDL